MSNIRENVQLETERHDEIFKALAELNQSVKTLSDQVNKYEPMFDYFNKGSIIAKSLIFLLKWSSITVVGLGSLASAYIVLKQFLNGQS